MSALKWFTAGLCHWVITTVILMIGVWYTSRDQVAREMLAPTLKYFCCGSPIFFLQVLGDTAIGHRVGAGRDNLMIAATMALMYYGTLLADANLEFLVKVQCYTGCYMWIPLATLIVWTQWPCIVWA